MAMDQRKNDSEGGLGTQTKSEPQNPGCSSPNSNNNPNSYPPMGDLLEEAPEIRIERLGRQRPEVFKSLWAEIGFVFSISMSQVLTVSFVLIFNLLICSADSDSGEGVFCFWLHSYIAHSGQKPGYTIGLRDMARQRFFAHPGLLSPGFRSFVRYVWRVSSICRRFHLACFVESDRRIFHQSYNAQFLSGPTRPRSGNVSTFQCSSHRYHISTRTAEEFGLRNLWSMCSTGIFRGNFLRWVNSRVHTLGLVVLDWLLLGSHNSYHILFDNPV